MSAERAAPCRHTGAPPQAIVQKVVSVVESLGANAAYLASQGLTQAEYELALPMAIQQLRGSKAASSKGKRAFLAALLQEMVSQGVADKIEMPKYGEDTIYRVSVKNVGDIAIIQKGCPDGAHSSVRWSKPEWAVETYVWWLCSSLTYDPGEHVARGVNRLRQRFFSDAPDTLDGVIFHNELCGSADRPCPKISRSVIVGAATIPPPCIYVMPARDSIGEASEWNWQGEQQKLFPSILLSMFGIAEKESAAFVGYIGFQKRGQLTRSVILSAFGPGRSTKFRS